MVQSNNVMPSLISQRDANRIYFKNRKEIKSLIKNMNACLDNNSSTFFLTLFYMDLIFENYSIEQIMEENMNIFDISLDNINSLNNYVLLSLACLVIASKFNEKDPHVPDLNSFIRVYNQYSKFYFVFSISELMKAEVNILKILEYKLNYYSLYQFITFFFTNGILFEKNMRDSDIIRKFKYSEKRVLEKVYVKSREILDIIIDDYDNYFQLFNGAENYLTAMEILIWSIENVLNIQIINEENYYFPIVYGININYRKHIEIYSIIYSIIENNSNTNKNKNLSYSVINNYNFIYGEHISESQIDLLSNKNNLYLMSISNSNINNINDVIKEQRITSDFKNKNSKSYILKKDKNNEGKDYLAQLNEINRINSISNELNSRTTYNIFQENYHKKINKINENQSMNIIRDNFDISTIKETKETRKSKNKLLKSDLSRNLTNKFHFNYSKENEDNDKKKDYQSYIKNDILKNIFKPINNYNEINPYSSKKNYEKKNIYYNNNNSLTKKNIKELKASNKRNLNMDYNNSSKSTCYKSWFNNTNPSPKDILNKTKKIFDESNKIIDFNEINNADESSNIIVNSYINKKNFMNNLKNTNNNNNNNEQGQRNKYNNNLNSNLSDSNIIYKIKNDYINNKINKLKEEKNKEKTIIINNNIQINNYVDKENTFNNIYKTSHKDINDIENINLENYINKKYFSINYNKSNSKSIYLDHINYNNKIIKEKNKRKINYKKNNNYLYDNNIKENKNINNNNYALKKNKDHFKLNKDKSNRILNFGKFHTYFDYSSYDKKDNEYSHENLNYNM